MPLFVVICARLILFESQSCEVSADHVLCLPARFMHSELSAIPYCALQVYLSLAPIMLGVFIATMTELSFNLAGFLSALASTFTYAFLNTFVKKVTGSFIIRQLLSPKSLIGGGNKFLGHHLQSLHSNTCCNSRPFAGSARYRRASHKAAQHHLTGRFVCLPSNLAAKGRQCLDFDFRSEHLTNQ